MRDILRAIGNASWSSVFAFGAVFGGALGVMDIAWAKIQGAPADVSVVPASTLQRLTDSVRAAEDEFSRYCATQGAPQYVRRGCAVLTAARRGLDSLHAARTAPAGGPLLSFVDRLERVDGSDSVFTRCTLIHLPDHTEHVGWPPLRIFTLGDSARVVARFGNPLREMCSQFADRLAMRDSLPTRWESRWVVQDGRRVYRPGAIWP